MVWRTGQILIILLALFMGLCVALGSAVECNSTIGVTACTVSSSLTLAQGTYYYNSTGTGSGDGVLVIAGSNLVFDGRTYCFEHIKKELGWEEQTK